MNYNDLLELVKSRRSTRSLKSDPLPDEIIDKIIEAARWAPSGFNTQPWEFIVVKKQELKDRIVRICQAGREQYAEMEATREAWQGKAPKLKPKPGEDSRDFSNAPVFIILCGDTRTRLGLPMGRRFDPYRWETVFISGLASAFLNMQLAATSLGIGSRWVSAVSTPYGKCMLKDLLGIPDELEIYEMMVLGYPAMKHRPKLMRGKAEMVHYDVCCESDFRTDAEVKDFLRKTRRWNIATERRKADKSIGGSLKRS
jgi:nitroreductase